MATSTAKPEEVYARVLGEFDLVNVSIEFDHPFQDLQGRDLDTETVYPRKNSPIKTPEILRVGSVGLFLAVFFLGLLGFES